MTKYQRGTDLKHCPDDCSFQTVIERYWVDAELLRCLVQPHNTCPREQLDKNFTPANVRILRDKTGMWLGFCSGALRQTHGDMTLAEELLSRRGF